jgi:hypothetical protein
MEIVKQIEEALARGQVVLIPTPSLGDRDETSLVTALCLLFRLRHSEGRVLMKMVTQGSIGKAEIFKIVAHSEQTVVNGTVAVLICRLRKKLLAHGIEIGTLRGVGYALRQGSREKIIRQLAEHDAGIVSTTPPVQPQPSV